MLDLYKHWQIKDYKSMEMIHRRYIEMCIRDRSTSSEETVSSEIVSEQPVESQVPEYYNYPVAGQEILNGFSNGCLLYTSRCV